MTEPNTKREIDDDVLAIRQMLAQEQTAPLTSRRAEWREPSHAAQAASAEPPATVLRARPAPRSAEAPPPRRAAPGLPDLPMLDVPEDDMPLRGKAQGKTQGKGKGKAREAIKVPRPRGAGLSLASLRGYRPKRAHVLALLGFAFVLWRPWLVLTLLVLPPLITLGLLIALGQDRFWDGAMRGFKWYARRRPTRAERLRRRLDAFAMRWDAILDRFPERLVAGLYLPDFDSLAEREAQHERAVDARMERLRHESGAR